MIDKNYLINKYNLNDKQALVVLNKDKELIVPAGAGSGKTKTLVTKVVELIKSGESLESFLVLTFTKKAAAEMKARIKLELKNEGLEHLVNKIDSANISTFDSFAYNFVKQNASLIKLDSNIELLDPASLFYIKTSFVKDLVYEIMSNEESNYYNLLKNYTTKTSELDFINDFIKLYDALISLKPLNEYDENNLINEQLLFTNNFKEEVLSLSMEFYENNINIINTLESYMNYLNGNGIMPDVSFRFTWGIPDDLKKQIEKVLKTPLDLYKAKITKEEYLNVLNNLKNDAKLLYELLVLYEKKIVNFKYETNKFEFLDIANFLNKLLVENKDLLNRLKDNTKFVFVDEYQDTSLVQSNFLNMLIKDNDLIKVLYVGDLKQSIYKFRDAKPETFIEKQKTVSNISLDINYRSSSDIIDFVNNLFTNILTNEEKHDLVYRNNHYMLSGSTAFKNDKFASVYLIEQFSEDSKSNIVEEAFLVGHKIQDLIKKGVTNKYNDFAILARNKTSFNVISDVFKYLQIPLQVQMDFNLKQTYLLKLISNILTLSQNLNKENIDKFKFDYISIIRSELMMISDFEIFLDIKDNLYSYFNKGLPLYEKLFEVNKAIITKSNLEIIETVINLFNINEAILKAPKVLEKELQIDYLLNLAKPLSDLGIYGIKFAEYIKEIAYDEDLTLLTSVLQDKDENSVVLTNIHQSKGLEYPILFLVDLNRNFSSSKVKSFIYSKDYGLLMRRVSNERDKLIVSNIIRNGLLIENDESLKEELRLLYTAITRAERSLYIVGTKKDSYTELNSFNDYLYEFGMEEFIKKSNKDIKEETYANFEYFNKLKDENLYYPETLNIIKEVKFKKEQKAFEEEVASININELIDDKLKESLHKGTLLHEGLEFGNLFNKLLEMTFNNKKISDGITYKELPFYFELNNKIKEGIIDLVVEYKDEIHIIDYKTYDIDPNKYQDQLTVYESYLKLIYPNKKVLKYLYSIILNKVIKVEEPQN